MSTEPADITREEVLRIAALAHLDLGAEELERMTHDLGSILRYVHQLQRVDVTRVPPTAHVQLEALPLRDDAPRPSLDRDKAVEQAPEARDGAFVVPAFVDG